MNLLLSKFKKINSNYFSYKELIEAGLSKYEIQKALNNNIIERLNRGIYCLANKHDFSEWDDFICFSKTVGKPNAICLLSALSYYNLTDIIPKQTWILVSNQKRCSLRKIRLIRARNPLWDIGIIKNKDFWMTSLERTIIDSIHYHKILGKQIGIEALKRTLKAKQTNLNNILKIAKKMKMEHRIMHYIEAIAL